MDATPSPRRQRATQGRSLVTEAPRVSIGLPVRNGEGYLAEALASLAAQTFRDFEVVISDNASDDGTERICREWAARDPRIRYLRQPENVGGAGNYNLVFEAACGELFKWAAHDDRLAPTFLARCVEALDREPAATACFARTRYIDADGARLRESQADLAVMDRDAAARVRRFVRLAIAGDDVFMAVFGLFRREALAKTRLIDRYVASDQVLLLELVLQGGLLEVPEPLFERRLHAQTSMIKNRRPHEQASWFDPSRQPRVVMPMWRLWRAHNAAIARSSLSWRQRWTCYRHVARRFLRKWPALLGEMKKAIFQLFGRR